jgi:CRISPR-associated protein Cmr2
MFMEGLRPASAPYAADDRDLVVIALSGVQRFISESRSTSDLSSASGIVARLAAEAALACRQAGAEFVFPAGGGDPGHVEAAGAVEAVAGMPNRVVALAPAGTGAAVAGRAAAVVRERWAGWVRSAFGRDVATPGMPSVQWVCAPADLGGYEVRWEKAQAALAARRRVRDFPEVGWAERRLCSLSPRWPAEDDLPQNLARLAEHQRDVLSAANWVKRLWRQHLSGWSERRGFPSTSSIASAPFRMQVLGHLDAVEVRAAVAGLWRVVKGLDPVRETPLAGLRGVVGGESGEPGEWFAAAAGRWVYEDTWQEDVLAREYGGELAGPSVARDGRRAARRLLDAMRDGYGVAAPTDYLALLAQDLDGMGRFLGGEEVAGRRVAVTAGDHREVSRSLRETAAEQCRRLASPDLLAEAVYAGGDDLLAFAPAATALAAARACHALVPAELPTASTAVLFFHHRSSLRLAVTEVRRLLEDAKDASPDKHALAVGYLRRSGVRERSIQPWESPQPIVATGQTDRTAGGVADRRDAGELFGLFTPTSGAGRALSPRLVADLERDADELADPGLGDLYRLEIARLVVRHGGSSEDAKALAQLGLRERSGQPPDSVEPARRPAAAARVAVFIRQECR